MIRRLVVLQFRSGWRATVSTAATVALAVAFGTFAMVLAATQIAHQASFPGVAADPDRNGTMFTSVLGEIVPGPDMADAGLINVVSLDELDALLDVAAHDGPVSALWGTTGRVPGKDASVTMLAFLDDSDADVYLAHGSLPLRGEIALSATLAASLELDVGDTITLESLPAQLPKTTATLTVAGILRDGDGGVGPYSTFVPNGVVSWRDRGYLARTLPDWVFTDPDTGEAASLVQTQVFWSGYNPTLSKFEYWNDEPYGLRFHWSEALAGLSGMSGWALLLAGVTVVCLITAALGMGRSRAEARTRWAGTARVLGATRGTIAAASVVETLVVAVAGAGLGLGAGALAAHLHLLYLRGANPDVLVPSAISVPSVLVGAALLLGVGLAVILAAVPAFWASRVSPVAALKPVTPIRDATLSRVVNPWWPFGIMAGGIVTAVTFMRLNVDGALGPIGDLGAGLGKLAWVVAGAAVVVQVARGIVAGVGRWLARSRVPWVLAAGDGLLSHRRSFTFAALATSVLSALLAISATMSVFTALNWTGNLRGWNDVPPLPFPAWWNGNIAEPGVLAFAAVAFAVIVVIATTVRASSRASTAQEDATRSALGLSHRGARAAVALRDSAVMAAGTVVGGLAGWALSVVWRMGASAIFPTELAYSFRGNATSAVYGLAATGAFIGIGLAASLVGGLLVSRLAAAAPPVAAIGRGDV